MFKMLVLQQLHNLAKQFMRGKLFDHKGYIDRYGEDLPEIRGWKWGQRNGKESPLTQMSRALPKVYPVWRKHDFESDGIVSVGTAIEAVKKILTSDKQRVPCRYPVFASVEQMGPRPDKSE